MVETEHDTRRAVTNPTWAVKPKRGEKIGRIMGYSD